MKTLLTLLIFNTSITLGVKNEAWYDNQLKHVSDMIHGIKLQTLANRLKLGNPVIIKKPIPPDPFYWAVYTTSTLRICLAAHNRDHNTFNLITNLSLLEYAYNYNISTNKTNIKNIIPSAYKTKRNCVKPHLSKVYPCPYNFKDKTNKYVSYFNYLSLSNIVTIKKIEKDLKLPPPLETRAGCILDPKWAIVYYTNSTLIILGANQIEDYILHNNSNSNFLFNGYWSVRYNFKLP